MLAVRIRWDLKERFWFWATIVLVLVIHVPLFLFVRWPHGRLPPISLMPLGVADLLITLGAVALAEKIFSRDSSSGGR
jgi:hypothetical protein